MSSKKPFAFITDKGELVRSDVLKQYQNDDGEQSKQIKDRFINQYGRMNVVEPIYNPEALVAMLEMNTYHYRCVKTKARDTAGLGWKLVETEEGRGNDSNKQRLLEFFENQPVPIAKTFEQAMIDRESIGQLAIEVRRVGDDPNEEPNVMYHVPAHTIRKHQEENKFCQIRGTQTRWFKWFGYEQDVHKDEGHESALGTLEPEDRATEMLWSYNYTPKSDYYGLPDIMPAIGAIHGDLARRDYNISFFDNYGVPSYAVTITGNYDPGEYDEEEGMYEIEKTIRQHFKNLQNLPHSTLVLSIPSVDGEGEVKVNFEPLSVETKEASFRMFRKDNRDEVLTAHNVPPYRVGVVVEGSLGGNTAQESTEIYKNSVIDPRQEDLENLINTYIIQQGFGIYDWKFRFAQIDTKDEQKDIDMARTLFDRGAMTPNEMIRNFADKFGLTEIDHPAMDAHYIQGQPIDLKHIDISAVDPQQLLEQGIVTENEIRKQYGLEPKSDGDEFRDPEDLDDGAQEVMMSLQNELIDLVEKEVTSGDLDKSSKNSNTASKLVELFKAITSATTKHGEKIKAKIK